MIEDQPSEYAELAESVHPRWIVVKLSRTEEPEGSPVQARFPNALDPAGWGIHRDFLIIDAPRGTIVDRRTISHPMIVRALGRGEDVGVWAHTIPNQAAADNDPFPIEIHPVGADGRFAPPKRFTNGWGGIWQDGPRPVIVVAANNGQEPTEAMTVDLISGEMLRRFKLPGRVGWRNGPETPAVANVAFLSRAAAKDRRLLALSEGWSGLRRIGPPRIEIWDVEAGRLIQTVSDHLPKQAWPSLRLSDRGAGFLEFVEPDWLEFTPVSRMPHSAGRFSVVQAGPSRRVRLVDGSATEAVETPSEPAPPQTHPDWVSVPHAEKMKTFRIRDGNVLFRNEPQQLTDLRGLISDRENWTIGADAARRGFVVHHTLMESRIPSWILSRLERFSPPKLLEAWSARQDEWTWVDRGSGDRRRFLSLPTPPDKEPRIQQTLLPDGLAVIRRESGPTNQSRLEIWDLPPPRWGVGPAIFAGFVTGGLAWFLMRRRAVRATPVGRDTAVAP